MTITVLGTGYVGLTSAAIFAAIGYKTYVVDINKTRLDAVREGRSFFYEEGMDALVKYGVDSKTLIPTNSYKESVTNSDVVFSCVGTPSNPDGSCNLSYVFSAATEAASHMKPNCIFVQKSTVPVGTGKKVIAALKSARAQIHYVSNPEFLREGTALADTLWFDRIVVGGDNKTALNRVISIYKKVEDDRDRVAAISGLQPINLDKGEYITTSLNSAELIKVSANAFLAMKISFANSIARLADVAEADVVEVMDAVGADKRIGRAFLNAGRGYGGGCFPKDVSGLISSGMEFGVDLELIQATSQVNTAMPGYIAERLKEALGDTLNGKKIAVLGLSFKKGTSDTRLSPGITLANILVGNGALVNVYDPEAMEEAVASLDPAVKKAKSITSALTDCDGALVTTDWEEFLAFSAKDYAKHLKPGAVLFDCMNCIPNYRLINKAGLKYMGIGRR